MPAISGKKLKELIEEMPDREQQFLVKFLTRDGEFRRIGEVSVWRAVTSGESLILFIEEGRN
jgi:hypothetical protein